MTTSIIKILHIEDNRLDALMIKGMLEKVDPNGFNIDNADSMKAARQLYQVNTYDIVLLDLFLPDASYPDTLKIARETFTKIPIVILSISEQEDFASTVIRDGAQDYLVKGQITPEIIKRTTRFAIERKKMELALHESQKRFQLAVEGSNDGIWDWPNINDDYEYWSPRFKELLGYKDNEIEAGYARFLELLHPDDVGVTAEAVKRHLESKIPYDIEYRLQTKSGKYRWFHARGDTIRDENDNPIRMSGSISDIHNRKEDEAALSNLYDITSNQSLNLETKATQILKNSLEYLDMSFGAISHANSKNYETLYTNSDIKSVTAADITEIDYIFSAHTIQKQDILAINNISNSGYQDIEHELVGSYIGKNIYVNGKPYGTVSFYGKKPRTILFQEREKNFMRLISQWIANEIESEEYSISQKNLEQSRRLESIGQLAAGIAHEINTPSQFIGDNLRFIQGGFKSLDSILAIIQKISENKKISYDAIQQESETLGKSTNLDFILNEIPEAIDQSLDGINRIKNIVDAMKGSVHPDNEGQKPTNINEEIQNACTLSRSEWKHVADIETDLDEKAPSIIAFPYEINQVILNMIINASHTISDAIENNIYSKGLIKISTKIHENPNSNKTKDNFFKIKISDNGMGIPLEIQQKIFDPFFTTKEVGIGTGQGLSLAHHVIKDKHKGDISIDSEVGKGTTFTIKIPLTLKNQETENLDIQYTKG